MHDAVAAERAGTPAVSVMTEPFVGAAQLMAKAQGVPAHPFAVIDHPIASATDGQLAARAAATASYAAEVLTGG